MCNEKQSAPAGIASALISLTIRDDNSWTNRDNNTSKSTTTTNKQKTHQAKV